MTAFWGRLALVKFLDLIGFEGSFEDQYVHPQRVPVNIDTTASTVYGAIEGARKGHNPKQKERVAGCRCDHTENDGGAHGL